MSNQNQDKSFKLPLNDYDSLTGITHDQTQRACRIVADNATTTKDAALMLNMVGIWPDKEYQEYLRKA